MGMKGASTPYRIRRRQTCSSVFNWHVGSSLLNGRRLRRNENRRSHRAGRLDFPSCARVAFETVSSFGDKDRSLKRFADGPYINVLLSSLTVEAAMLHALEKKRHKNPFEFASAISANPPAGIIAPCTDGSSRSPRSGTLAGEQCADNAMAHGWTLSDENSVPCNAMRYATV